MKLHYSSIFLLFVVFVYSCNRKSSSTNSVDLHPTNDSTITQCYTSVAGKDSASMVLHTRNGKVEGELKLFFATKDDLGGQIAGTYRGDTLFADFTYQAVGKKPIFKNPFAFLVKDGKLYQGYGELISSVGVTTFKKGSPITFDRGFVFNAGDCK